MCRQWHSSANPKGNTVVPDFVQRVIRVVVLPRCSSSSPPPGPARQERRSCGGKGINSTLEEVLSKVSTWQGIEGSIKICLLSRGYKWVNNRDVYVFVRMRHACLLMVRSGMV